MKNLQPTRVSVGEQRRSTTGGIKGPTAKS